MKHIFLQLSMLIVLIGLPFSAIATMSETDAYTTVQSMLSRGNFPSEVIAVLKDDGRSRPEATVFAMVAGGESHRVALAVAGVETSTSLMEAQLVVQAVLATAGEFGPVADAVREAMQAYAVVLEPPSTFDGGQIANGSGASPST